MVAEGVNVGGASAPAAIEATRTLLRAARPLLDQVDALRHTPPPKDPRALRARLLAALQAFDDRATASGVDARHRQAGSYLLCTMLDEVVAGTAWGAACRWSRDGLLVSRHGEGFGGERFFLLAQRAGADPVRHAPLLELMAVMLGLGFEGRHALDPDGPRQLEACRRRLLQAAARVSPRTTTASAGPATWPLALPSAHHPAPAASRWRALAVVAAVVLAPVALDRAIAWRVDARAGHAIGLLAALRVPLPPDPVATPQAPAPGRARLAEVLRPEIDAGWVEVEESAGQSRVTLVGDQLYEPGESRVRPSHREVLARIAAALDRVPGRILVTGHTDDRPVRAGEGWDSNQALSLARARQVAALLAPALRDPGRLMAEGRADRQPRASNGTEAGRARNRRVEIGLLEEAGEGDGAARH